MIIRFHQIHEVISILNSAAIFLRLFCIDSFIPNYQFSSFHFILFACTQRQFVKKPLVINFNNQNIRQKFYISFTKHLYFLTNVNVLL